MSHLTSESMYVFYPVTLDFITLVITSFVVTFSVLQHLACSTEEIDERNAININTREVVTAHQCIHVGYLSCDIRFWCCEDSGN